jgi:hypothetical protein
MVSAYLEFLYGFTLIRHLKGAIRKKFSRFIKTIWSLQNLPLILRTDDPHHQKPENNKKSLILSFGICLKR